MIEALRRWLGDGGERCQDEETSEAERRYVDALRETRYGMERAEASVARAQGREAPSWEALFGREPRR